MHIQGNDGTDITTFVRVTSTGNVGIGTVTPKTKLNVYTFPHTDTGGILVQNANYSSNLNKAYLIAGTQDWTGAATDWSTYGFQHKLKSDASGSPRLTIDGSAGGSNIKEIITFFAGGNVGIGSISPTQKLDVDGTVKATSFSGNGANITNVNATTLDSIDSTGFLRTNITQTCSGQTTFTNQLIAKLDGVRATQTGVALVITHSTTPALRANHFIVDDYPSGGGTYFIQATEAGVSNDRNICLQGYGGKVKIGAQGTAPTEVLDVSGGNVKADNFIGGLPITNGADNRIVTCTSASAIAGESAATFDGSSLNITGSGSNLALNVVSGYMRSVGGQPTVVAHKSSSTFCHIGVEGNTNARAFLAYTNDKDFIIGRRSSYTGDHTGYSGADLTIDKTNHAVQLSYNGGGKFVTTNTGIKLTSGVASGGGISNMLQLDNTGNNNGDGGKITFSRAGTIRTEIEALKNETANNETDIVFRTTNAGSLGEKLRITSDGLIQTKARSAGVRRMILSGSPTNTAFNIEAHDGATGTSANTNQGELGLYYNDGSTLTDEAVIKFYRGSGAGDGYFGFNTGSTEKLRIVADGKLMTSATGYIYTSSSAGSLTLYGGNTNKGGGIILSGGNSPSTGDIRFYAQMSQSSPAERLRITSGGDTELRNIVSGITNSYSQYLKFRTTQTNNQSAVTGQIAAQGTSSWGGELVFYTKPANGSPNDTVTERVRIHDNGQLDNLSTSAINTKFKTSNSNGSYNIYEMGNSGASLGFIGSGTQLATGGGATDFCIRAQSGGLKLCTSGADVRAYIQSSSFKEIVFPQQSNDTFAQRVYRTTVSGVTAQAYTKFATVSGTDLSSHIKMTTHTTIGSVVCSQDWDIKAGHSHDFFVTSTSLAYTESKIKIISNGNQNYDLYLQRSGGANQADGATYRVVIHPMCQESVTFNSTVNYSTVTHEHSSSQGARKITASGGVGGNFIMPGTITKGGGTFTIPHPLASKKDTHKLSHSFIEGPQMDLIYRGKTTLVAGISTVNIDTNSNMTEGTFVLLNRDVQCFTTNETGWTNIKGSVTGNKITIIAQDNSCTDTISWMVVGERQDDTAKSLNMTDDDGNLIVEPAIEEDVDRSSLQELYPTL